MTAAVVLIGIFFAILFALFLVLRIIILRRRRWRWTVFRTSLLRGQGTFVTFASVSASALPSSAWIVPPWLS